VVREKQIRRIIRCVGTNVFLYQHCTDGFNILFGLWPYLNGAYVIRSKEDGSCMLSIDAESFMDLLMVDRTKEGAPRY
jgi:hypothetical protein